MTYLSNSARYWLRTPWRWHNSVETCRRSVIVCQLIVHLLVTVQNNKRCRVQILKYLCRKLLKYFRFTYVNVCPFLYRIFPISFPLLLFSPYHKLAHCYFGLPFILVIEFCKVTIFFLSIGVNLVPAHWAVDSALQFNPSAWGHLNPSSYCDVGRLFYGVFKLWSKLQRKKWRNNF